MAGKEFPIPKTNKTVVFESFFQRGFGLSAHPFLCGLLYFYGIEICHLNPHIHSLNLQNHSPL